MIYSNIYKCRICGNTDLYSIVDLGNMALTGVFPQVGEKSESGPLELVKCDSRNGKGCGLIQLRHNFQLEKLYGDNYGYRSGLNKSMVKHLEGVVEQIKSLIKLREGDLVIDIGSNDGTMLSLYGESGYELVGIDPTIRKFLSYYPSYIETIPEFFSSKLIKNKFKDKKAKVVTSIAMFYDLESPQNFMKQIYEILDDQGIWVLEQSYTPRMIENVSYDTICHEHLEYYCLKQIEWMAQRTGFKIVNVELNESNGASFRVILAKRDSSFKEERVKIEKILTAEKEKDLENPETYNHFRNKIIEHKNELIKLINQLISSGKKVYGYGASTKGSVILQLAKLTSKEIPAIVEVNEYKFGRLAPGTDIPIISEREINSVNPDYLLVLPWHFRKAIVEKEIEFLSRGGKLIFPLPVIDIHSIS